MSQRKRIYDVIILLLVAAAIGAGIYFTSPQDQTTKSSRTGRQLTPMSRLVDQRPLLTAQQLDKVATTREEGRYSREALRVADHEVDLAFTSALRNARVHPAPESPETKKLHDRLRQLQLQVAADEDLLKKLNAEITTARGNVLDDLQDRQQLLSAELGLRQDELEGAKRDLMRAGGDDESRIQRLYSLHEAAQHNDQATQFQARDPFQLPGSMFRQLQLWWQLHQKRAAVLEAGQQSSNAVLELDRQHDELERKIGPPASAQVPDAMAPATDTIAASSNTRPTSAALATLKQQSEDRKMLSEYDERIQDHQQLAQIYGDWGNLLSARMRSCIHAALQGLLWIVGIIALVLLGNLAVDRLSLKLASDRRRMATVRLLGRFVVQSIGLVLIIFVLLGPPSQLSTVLALAGAGLTVALKDFIVAFFGWFVLMGKHGIRVGDWVEINGIGGEVVEIGLLRTVLLETGNWADAGHPTGRRVTFVNSFAIEGHYFNFSTSGQWMWDTLEVLVPSGRDPNVITQSILGMVKKESEPNEKQAEKEWLRASSDYGKQSFSAEPALSLRPTASGTNVIVRYITRANDRYATRTRLYQEVVNLLNTDSISKTQAARDKE